jgi:hypothetical protein
VVRAPANIDDSAEVRGHPELRGANTSKTSGAYCGFVDPAINDNRAMADVTIAPPYVWRPSSFASRRRCGANLREFSRVMTLPSA